MCFAGDTGAKMAQILHDLTKLGVVPSLITEYTRQNAQTQALNVTTQLDNGIRLRSREPVRCHILLVLMLGF